MKTLSKKLIVNEYHQPVAVIIPWQEYQTLEPLLKLTPQKSTLPIPLKTLYQPRHLRLNQTSEANSKALTDSSTVSPKATARSLLKFAGSWVGEDLSECLQQVYQLRGKTLL
jgi:hypothetical protein